MSDLHLQCSIAKVTLDPKGGSKNNLASSQSKQGISHLWGSAAESLLTSVS